LELPFVEADSSHSSALDAYVSEIDRALDALFMEAVGGELERLRLARLEQADDAVA
jgi:hypothetical protein